MVAEAVVASAWNRRSCSYVEDYVAFLGSSCTGVFQGITISSPLWWLMVSAWVLTGALIAAASIGLSRRLAGWRRSATAALGLAQAVALVLFAVFPLGPETMADGLTLSLYLLGAFGSIIAGNTLAVVTGLSGRAHVLGHEAGDEVGAGGGDLAGDEPSQGVGDQVEGLVAELGQQGRDVLGEELDGVGAGPVAGAVAAEVDGVDGSR